MITIKDYAYNHNVSYEAVRKQLRRYADQLEGHITRKNRTQYLDEYAEQFLTGKRQQSVVIVHEQAKEDALESSRAENEELRKALQEMQLKHAQAMLTIQKLQADQIVMLQEKLETIKQLEDHTRLQRDLKDMMARAESAETENRKYKKTWFGLYKKTED